MASRSSDSLQPPDLLQPSMAPFSFSPLSPAPSSSSSYPAPVRPAASSTFRILPSAPPARPAVAKRKGGVEVEGAMEGVEPVSFPHPLTPHHVTPRPSPSPLTLAPQPSSVVP